MSAREYGDIYLNNIAYILIKQNPPEVYRQWVEDGSDKMLEKWRSSGIHPSDENYLGKWLKNKEVILKLIDQ